LKVTLNKAKEIANNYEKYKREKGWFIHCIELYEKDIQELKNDINYLKKRINILELGKKETEKELNEIKWPLT